LSQLPVLAAAIYEVLPLEARLARVALIDSATGELCRFARFPGARKRLTDDRWALSTLSFPWQQGPFVDPGTEMPARS
jgi:hypothetical protein